MSNTPRPETSKNKPFWIERHRYYELKHFCLQYPVWKKMRAAIDGMSSKHADLAIFCQTGDVSNPTANAAEARLFYTNRIEMLERTAKMTDPVIGDYILIGVTTGMSYDILNAREQIPCSRDIYYDLYRKFFWMLDKERD